MKKILMFMMIALLLTACGKTDELQTQVDDLTAEVESLTTELEDTQSELGFAESAVSLCVTSLKEEVATASGLRGTLKDAQTDLTASEDDLQACLDELEAETTDGEEIGGGEGECAGTERILMMSTPVLQQALDKNDKPKYNNQGKMVMTAIDNSHVEDFTAGDVVCVTEHYPVAGGWAVFLISGTREANFNLFVPAHYLEPLPITDCDPSYPTVCIPPPPPYLNCGDVSYENFVVVGSDPHGFDSGGIAGIGCESD